MNNFESSVTAKGVLALSFKLEINSSKQSSKLKIKSFFHFVKIDAKMHGN